MHSNTIYNEIEVEKGETNQFKVAVDKSTKFVSPFVLKYNTLLIYSYIFPEMGDASFPKSHQSEFAFSLLFGT